MNEILLYITGTRGCRRTIGGFTMNGKQLISISRRSELLMWFITINEPWRNFGL